MPRRRRGFGSPPSAHEDRMRGLVVDAKKNAKIAVSRAERGDCGGAFRSLLTAQMGYGGAISEARGTERGTSTETHETMRKMAEVVHDARFRFAKHCVREG